MAIENFDTTGMTLDERTLLGHRILLEVHNEVQSSPLTPEQLAEIDRRLDDEEAGRSHFTPWEEVRKKLLMKLKA